MTRDTLTPARILTDHDIGNRDDPELPPTDDGDKFCHIQSGVQSGDGRTAYCGYRLKESKATCKLYDGEAICPTCGRPTCPSCAVQSSLHERLVGEDSS